MSTQLDGTHHPIVGYRLSPQQLRVWPFCRENSSACTSRCTLVVDGLTSLDALHAALRRVVARHEILRTTFQALTGMGVPVQVVADGDAFGWEVAELDDVHLDWATAAWALEINVPRGPDFDPSARPLLRVVAARISPDTHALVITASSLCVDGASLSVLAADLGRALAGELDDEPVQYADYAEWANEALAASNQGDDATRRAPQSPIASPSLSFAPEYVARTLDSDARAMIERAAASVGASRAAVLFACFQLLLHRLGESDGVHVLNEGRDEEVAQAIGLFEQYVPVDLEVNDDLSVRELIARAGHAIDHRPGVLESSGGASLPRFLFDDRRRPPAGPAGACTVSMRDMIVCSQPSALRLCCIDASELQFHFDPSMFERPDVEQLADRYALLLDRALRDEGESIASVDVTFPEERQRARSYSLGPALAYEAGRTVVHLIDEQARVAGDKIAVSGGNRQLSYAELNAVADQWARVLRARGVASDVLVGMCVDRSVDAFVAILAIWKAGGAYVPLDPAYPQERLAAMLADAKPLVVVTLSRLAGALPSTGTPMVFLDAPSPAVGALDGAGPPLEDPPDRLAYVIYTSGTTGAPKGVAITHANLYHYAHALPAAIDIAADDVYLHTASFSFSSSVRQTLLPLCRGAAVVVATADQIRAPLALFELIRRERVTVVDIVPTYWRTCLEMLKTLGEDARSELLDNSLRLILSASEPLPRDLPAQWMSIAGGRASTVNMYGQTETAGIVAVRRVDPADTDGVGVVPIGRPVSNLAIYILNSRLQAVPVGVTGEMYVAGPPVGRGYHRRSSLSAERFLDDPFTDVAGGRLYRTGDLARFRGDGTIEILGRVDSQVKVRGFRIEPVEVEGVLRQHPGVSEAVVVAQADAVRGNRLVAFIVRRPEQRTPVAELMRHLKAKLPEYAVPARIEVLDRLPQTATGKIDRRALQAYGGDNAERRRTREAAPPATPTECALAAIWAEALGTDDFGIDDSFFDVGGQSLLAAQMLLRVRDALHVELTWQRLFEAPTIAGLAAAIDANTSRQDGPGEPQLQPVPRGAELRPSLGQQRLWFLGQLSPDTPVYNVVRAVRITGPLAVDRLEQSVNEILRRHEILRAALPQSRGEPVLVISPQLELRVEAISIPESEVAAALVREAERPFAIAAGPLVRCALFQTGPEQYVFVVVMHHTVTDGWSFDIFFRELGLVYDAFTRGEATLPDLPVQYVDFAEWQRRYVDGAAHAAHLDYWKEQLRGSGALSLPTDRPRPAVQSYRGGNESAVFSRDLAERLERLSRAHGATLFMTLLAAFQTLLHRYTGQDDVAVGSPIAGRVRAETENLIGMFINTLVLRTDLAGNPTFSEVLARVRRTALSAYQHQQVPFEKLVEALHPSRDLSRSPFFDVLFAFQNSAGPALTLPGLAVERVGVETNTAKFDLSLYAANDASPQTGGLKATLEYNTDLFEPATIRRMIGHFETLLEAIVRDPDAPISELPLLTDAERHQLIVEWNDTSIDVAANSLHRLIEAQTARTPEAIAAEHEGATLTYAELNRRANQLARYLRRTGVGGHSLVGVCVERSLDMLVALLATLKAGAAYVPLDPAYPAERLEFIVRDAGIVTLITQASLRGRVAGAGTVVCVDADRDTFAAEDLSNLGGEDGDLAYVIYTSGSTGVPKGVQIPHTALVNFLSAMRRRHPLTNRDALLAVTTISFDIAGLELFLPLITGARLIVASRDVAMDGTRLIEALNRCGASIMQATPTTWQLLIEAGWQGDKNLTILCGGEMLPRDLANQLVERCGSLWNMYGPTETTIWSTSFRVSAGATPVSIGRPIDNTTIYILDPAQNLVPVGVIGELHIGGAGVARGYLNRPALTEEKFILDRFSANPDGRLYRTGDLARYLPDGNIELLGRIDHQVKIRGRRIELGEIEAVLTQCPGVKQVVALVRDDVPGQKTLVAYVTGTPGESITSSELSAFASGKLPDYMIPSLFVPLQELPLTPNGKIDRKALPKPEVVRLAASEGRIAPRDHLEREVARIWEATLGVHGIGVRDNFFDLGGYSLLAVRVVSQIEAALGPRLPITALFQQPTIEGLAQLLRREVSFVPWSALAPLQPAGANAPFFWIHGEVSDAILPRLLGADQPVYGLLHQAHDGYRARYTTVEDIAAHYLSEIRTVQPHGPYFLGGFCFGAVVGFEIAHQLRRDNEEVALLALVDPSTLRNPPAQSGYQPNGPEWSTPANSRNPNRPPIQRAARRVIDLAQFVQGGIRKRVQALASSACLRLGLRLPHALRSQYVLSIYFDALKKYSPAPYPGPVVVFRPNQTWQGVLTGDIAVHDLVGSHAAVLRQPQLGIWAQTLKSCLRRTQHAEAD